jgi:SAM-dependent methyltransferase
MSNVRGNNETSHSSGFTRLREGLTGERGLVGVSYMDDPAMLRAYLDYYWPVSREQARVALSVSHRFSGDNCDTSFRRIIDVGSGPGPVAAAFVDAGATEAILIDQSDRALALAVKTIAERCESKAAVTILCADISRPDLSSIPLWGSADCVCFGHCLNELWAHEEDRVERRANLLALYSSALAPGGRILVIEPALLSTSRDLLAVRNLLVERGWSVCAPCPGRARLACPALSAGESHTCHEEIKWIMPLSVASIAKKEGLDKESLKMTWFMLEPPQTAGDGLTTANGSRAVDTSYRVVSDPMLNKGGRVRRLVCGTGGRFPLSAAQESADARRTGFDRLCRGDLVSVFDPEIRENGWGVGGDTVITLETNTK